MPLDAQLRRMNELARYVELPCEGYREYLMIEVSMSQVPSSVEVSLENIPVCAVELIPHTPTFQ